MRKKSYKRLILLNKKKKKNKSAITITYIQTILMTHMLNIENLQSLK